MQGNITLQGGLIDGDQFAPLEIQTLTIGPGPRAIWRVDMGDQADTAVHNLDRPLEVRRVRRGESHILKGEVERTIGIAQAKRPGGRIRPRTGSRLVTDIRVALLTTHDMDARARQRDRRGL